MKEEFSSQKISWSSKPKHLQLNHQQGTSTIPRLVQQSLAENIFYSGCHRGKASDTCAAPEATCRNANPSDFLAQEDSVDVFNRVTQDNRAGSCAADRSNEQNRTDHRRANHS
jgi:hypothetical protein